LEPFLEHEQTFTPHAFWNIADFDAKCEKCETINTITLETENLKNTYEKGYYGAMPLEQVQLLGWRAQEKNL
jgi:hypothetical protein